MEIYTQLGRADLDSLAVTKAAIVLHSIKDNPQFLRVKDGRDLHKKCLERIKGTSWESALFPVTDVRDERDRKEWRAKDQAQRDAAEQAKLAAFEADAAKSEAYISSVKKQGKDSGLSSAKDILAGMGFGSVGLPKRLTSPGSGPDDPKGAA